MDIQGSIFTINQVFSFVTSSVHLKLVRMCNGLYNDKCNGNIKCTSL